MFESLVTSQLPPYDSVDEEIKQTCILRAFKTWEDACNQEFLKGSQESMSINFGTTWVSDSSRESARFVFCFIIEDCYLNFQNMAKIRELEGFKKERDGITVSDGELWLEFRSEAYEVEDNG